MSRKFSFYVGASALFIAIPSLLHAQTAPRTVFTEEYRYDSLGRVVGNIKPDTDAGGPIGYVAQRTFYDANGLVTRIEDGLLAAWQPNSVAPRNWAGFTVTSTRRFAYDTLGQLIDERVVGSDNVVAQVVSRNYTRTGQPGCEAIRMNPAQFYRLPSNACVSWVSSVHGQDRITKTLYDNRDRVMQIRKGVGTGVEVADVTYTHTLNGNIQYLIDANGNRAELTYDGHDRQKRWIFPSATRATSYNPATQATAVSSSPAPNAGNYEEYGYDSNGNRTSLRRRDGAVLGFTYDALNRVTVKTVPTRPGLTEAQTADVYYGYDNSDNTLYARFDGLNGQGVTNEYNVFGENISSTVNLDGISRVLSFQYDSIGRRTRITHPDGNYFQHHYVASGAYDHMSLNGTVPLINYLFDAQGRVDRIQRRRPSVANWTSSTASYHGYDTVSRLASLTTNVVGTNRDITTTFARNPAGQIQSVTRNNDVYTWSVTSAGNRSYTVNGLNQYSAVAGASFTYSPSGNLTSDGVSTYVYDVENRLVSHSRTGSPTTTLRYDPLGRLYEVSNTASTTRFLHDGSDLVAEYNGSGVLMRRYAHGLSGGDDPLVWYEGAGVADAARRYLYTDERGSVVAVTNADGSTLNINSYDDYGVPGGSNSGRFQYTGQAWLSEIGMSYYKARMYSPTLGRFMQVDPIGYEDGFNIYEYSSNDPINKIDPSGLADLNLFAPSDIWYDYANSFDLSDSIFTVMAHGFTNGLIQDARNGQKSVIDANQLLVIMRENGYVDGQPIVITSCNCGRGSIPEQLARLTGSMVFFADGYVSFRPAEFADGDKILRSFIVRKDYTAASQGSWWVINSAGQTSRIGQALVDGENGLAFQFRNPHPNPTVNGVPVTPKK